MKKIFLIGLLFLSILLNAQTNNGFTVDTIYVNSYKEAINMLFRSIPSSHYPTGILLDKAGFYPKTAFANGLENDSSFNMLEWYTIYETIRIANADTTWFGFLELDSVKNNYIESNEILPIGIINFNVDKFRDSAFIDGSLTITNNALIESTGDLNKIYKNLNVFCVAPLNLDVNTLTPKFIILSSMIYSGTTNTISSIQIDLDDQLGFRTINVDIPFSASYSNNGYKKINTRIIYTNGDTLYSKSELYINDTNIINTFSKTTSDDYDFTFEVNTDDTYYPTDLSVPSQSGSALCGVWLGCGNTQIRKPIIIFSGYNPTNGKDLLDNGNPKWWNDIGGPVFPLAGWRGPLFETYNGSFTDFSSGSTKSGNNGANFIYKLLDEGYDIVICRFNDGIGYLQHNARVVAATIQEVNKRKRNAVNPGASINPFEYGITNSLMVANHENIVMGYSAGALCSRLGLTMMEKYVSQYGSHHTKSWVTIDCENQGSNVPIGFQMYLDFMAYSMTSLNPFDIFNAILCKKTLNILKTGGVATQNTLYHINHLYNAGGLFWNVNQDVDFNSYFSDLNDVSHSIVPANLKGYPIRCRRIGITQGNSNGLNNNIGNSDLISYRSPSQFGQVLFGVTPGRRANARPLTGANSNALFCNQSITIIFLFYSLNINISHWKYKQNNFILGHKPYDEATASTLTSHLILGDKLAGGEPYTWKSFTTNVTRSHNPNQHGFSTTVSGLDIHTPGNNNLPRFPDLSLTPANQGLLRINNYTSSNTSYSQHHDFGYPHINHPTNHYDYTPYDAVYAVGDPYPDYIDNQMHVEDPQPYIADFLVEEIAPKTLYLSNRTLIEEADFEARNSVLAGNQDIYKHGGPNPADWYPRLQTPPGDFVVSNINNPIVTIRSANNDGNSSIVLGAGFRAEHGCVFRAYIYQSTYCSTTVAKSISNNIQNNNDIREARPIISSKQAKGKLQPNPKINVTLFPNPSTGIIHFDFKEDYTYSYSINDVLGHVVQNGTINPSINEINLHDVKAGVYFITISNANYKQTERIILQ